MASSSRRVAVAALACMTPLRTEDKVASLALPNGIVRVDDTEDIKVTESFGPETSCRELASWAVPGAVDALMDGYSTSVLMLGERPEDLALGQPAAPGLVFYAIDRINDMCLGRQPGAWQTGVSVFAVSNSGIADLTAEGSHVENLDPTQPVSVIEAADEADMADAVNDAVRRLASLRRQRPVDNVVVRFALYDVNLQRGAFLNFVAIGDGASGRDTAAILRTLEAAGRSGSPLASALDDAAAGNTAARMIVSQLRDARMVVLGRVDARPGHTDATHALLQPLAVAAAGASSECQRHPASSFGSFVGGALRMGGASRRLNFGRDILTQETLASADEERGQSWPRPYETPGHGRDVRTHKPAAGAGKHDGGAWPRPYETPLSARVKGPRQAADGNDGDAGTEAGTEDIFALSEKEKAAADRAARAGAEAAETARTQARHIIVGHREGTEAGPSSTSYKASATTVGASATADAARRRVQELLARHRAAGAGGVEVPAEAMTTTTRSRFTTRAVRVSDGAGGADEAGLRQDLHAVRRRVQDMDTAEATVGAHYSQREEEDVKQRLHSVRRRMEDKAQQDGVATTSALHTYTSRNYVGRSGGSGLQPSSHSLVADAAAEGAKRTLHEEVLRMTEAKRSAQLQAERAGQELQRAQEELARVLKERDSKAEIIANQAAEIERLRRQQVDNVGSHAAVREQMVQREAQAERTTILNQELQAELARCREELQAVRAENVGLLRRAENSEASADSESARAELAERAQSEAESAVRARQKELREAIAGRIALEHEAERHRLRNVALENELELAAYSRNDLRRGVAETRANVAAEREEITSLRRQLEQVQGRLAKAEAERDASGQALGGAKDSTSQLQQQLEEYKAQLGSLNKRVDAMKKQRSSFQRNFESLMAVLVELHRAVEAAGKHAEACSLRGFYASKSKRLYENILEAYNGLVDVAVASNSKMRGRADVLEALKRHA